MSRARIRFANGKVVYREENGVATFVDREHYERKRSALAMPMVIRDIEPYQSMIDGTMITSRAEHRDHLKRHGKIEIGNEIDAAMKAAQPPPETLSENRRKLLHEQMANVTDKEANKVLKALKQAAKTAPPPESTVTSY